MANWISDASESTFDTEVVERSRTLLVLVDFWAPWCGPCRTLTPALQSVVEARKGSIWLVKINVDESPSLAQQYHVRGIPTVKAFLEGRIVGEFTGARDARSIEQFVDAVLPSDEDRMLEDAGKRLAAGNHADLTGTLQPLLDKPAYRDQALLLLAQSEVMQGKWDKATEVLDQIDDASPAAEHAGSLRLRAELLQAGATGNVDALRQRTADNPDDSDAYWALAGRLLHLGQVEPALEQLLELIQRDRKYRDDIARRAMLAIFDALGAEHEVSREYRRRLQIYI